MEDYKEKELKLRYRLLSAVIFLPILIWFIYWSWEWAFLFLITIIIFLGLSEYFKMVNQKGISCNQILGYLGALFLPFLFSKGDLTYPCFLLIALFIAILVSYILKKSDLSSVMQCISANLLGIIYVGWMPSHLLALKTLPNGNNLVLFVFTITWIGDTFAYFVGSIWGRHKIIPSISPNKTVEGTIAGVLGSILAVFLSYKLFKLPLRHYTFYLVFGIVIGIVALLGDLSESLLKRSTHIKDASTIIPGHGGILDRFDSIFFTAPVMYYLSRFFF